MKWLGRWSRWRDDESVEVRVSEDAGVRYLHLGSHTVQSAMRVARPEQLVLAYTRTAMAFLLFDSQPKDIVSVGLGGGSMQKWLRQQLPDARLHVIELHDEVVRVAHAHFAVPVADEQFRIVIEDAAHWISRRQDFADILIVDGYDGRGQAESICSEAFYRDAFSHLTDSGILVVNLWGSDKRFDSYVQRIEAAFAGRVICVPAAEKGNVIALAFRRPPHPTDWHTLTARAQELEANHGLEFTQMVAAMKRLNLHSDKRLLV